MIKYIPLEEVLTTDSSCLEQKTYKLKKILIKGCDNPIPLNDINYIEILDRKDDPLSRNFKILHLSTSHKYEGTLTRKIVWHTRSSLNKILNDLGEQFFVKVSNKVIVKKTAITGRDSDFEYIQLKGIEHNNINTTNWQPTDIKVGRMYKSQIRNFLELIEIQNTNKGGKPDIFYLYPNDIIYIKLTKEEKVFYLSFPQTLGKKKIYKLRWETRISAQNLLKHLRVNVFEQVNKSNIVNLIYMISSQIKEDQKEIELRLQDGTVKTIAVGKSYLKNLM
jgi:DNA-binding LytR/AlgR family response regulator